MRAIADELVGDVVGVVGKLRGTRNNPSVSSVTALFVFVLWFRWKVLFVCSF